MYSSHRTQGRESRSASAEGDSDPMWQTENSARALPELRSCTSKPRCPYACGRESEAGEVVEALLSSGYAAKSGRNPLCLAYWSA